MTDSDIDASGVQTKPSKAVITDARFKKAMEAILAGEYTREELEAKYSLTNTQKKSLES